MTERHARVVILAGPSGAGKSRLATRLQHAHGWPIVRLDDFYRDEDDPQMPRSEELGIIDWDHPDSWNREAALDALGLLVTEGRVETPVYDIGANRAVDRAVVTARPSDIILAEGIFAAENLKRVLRPAGTGADAVEPDWSRTPGLSRLTAFLETKTVWHPKGR